MEPKLCTTCGERPALPGDDECSICLLGYDSAEAKKTEWKPLLSGETFRTPSGYTHVTYDTGIDLDSVPDDDQDDELEDSPFDDFDEFDSQDDSDVDWLDES